MRNLFTRNLGLKAAALLLAVVSWFAIHETISFEVSLPDIPLRILTAEGWAVFQQSVNSVVVTVRGSQEDIRMLDRELIKAELDLHDTTIAGTQDVNVSLDALRGVRGVRVIDITPKTVQISFDHETEKMIPVRGRFVGKPFTGQVEEVLCEPAMVRVRGPAQQLQQTEWLYTEPVDVDGRIEGFVKRRKIMPPGDTWSSQIEPAEVQVEVVITEKIGSLEWKDVPVAVLANPVVPLAVNIQPARVTVLIAGSPSALESLQAKPPMAFVNCINLPALSMNYYADVQIYLPPEYNVSVQVQPPTVQIVAEQ